MAHIVILQPKYYISHNYVLRDMVIKKTQVELCECWFT